MKQFLFLAITLMLSGVAHSQTDDTYKGWKKGELDIHFIYTGRGEAVFYIFPDGTSMLVDAGDHQASVPMTDPKPDLSRRGGEWVARYIERVNPAGREVDYMMLSHFHDDHSGSASLNVPKTEGRTPDYKLVGIADVGESIIFGNFIDRGFPNYNYPTAINDSHISNYKNFVRWHKQQYGAKQEAFKVGAVNQIKLQKKPAKYAKTFSIRNIAASGEIWNGDEQGSTTRYYDLHPDNTKNNGNENTKSIAFRIDYGPFSYFAGGDLTHGVKGADGNNINLEAKAGEACGEVDVCKCNHHAYKDAMHPDFLKHINAQAYINPVWDQFHTQPEIIERMLSQEQYSGKKNAQPTMVLTQYIVESARKQHSTAEWLERVGPYNGHIVVKVYNKGKKYKIYRLSADDENMKIQTVYGPFNSKQ